MSIAARRIERVEVASLWDWIVSLVTVVLACWYYPMWCPVK